MKAHSISWISWTAIVIAAIATYFGWVTPSAGFLLFALAFIVCSAGLVEAVNTTSKLLVKHDLNVIGYWIPDSKSPAWDNTFVFLLAHSSQEEAAKNWQEMAADPVFQEIIKSEQKERLLDKADKTYMQPTDFSPMK